MSKKGMMMKMNLFGLAMLLWWAPLAHAQLPSVGDFTDWLNNWAQQINQLLSGGSNSAPPVDCGGGATHYGALQINKVTGVSIVPDDSEDIVRIHGWQAMRDSTAINNPVMVTFRLLRDCSACSVEMQKRFHAAQDCKKMAELAFAANKAITFSETQDGGAGFTVSTVVPAGSAQVAAPVCVFGIREVANIASSSGNNFLPESCIVE